MSSDNSETAASTVMDHNVEIGGKENLQTHKNITEKLASDEKFQKISDPSLDPSLPLNWSVKKKILNMGIPSLLCFVV